MSDQAKSKARVLDVGNCDPDHATIRQMLSSNFDVHVDRVMFVADALKMMGERDYALVLFNRLIFDDGSEGIALCRAAKADPKLQNVPVMMISNFAEAQAVGIQAGGEPGFGKKDVFAPETAALLAKYLPRID